ncbi:MAG: beta-ketoacyl synthase N-terminal-like domain-containing protein [Gloeotrichia echinulata DEX184]|nr:AMP-binding protein [Gloeotrichia echinulata DEX184]
MTQIILDILTYRSQYQSDKSAYLFLQNGETESATITYGELDKQARAIAAHLQSMQMQGERALLLYPSGLEFIAAFFGCLYAGVIAVPVNLPRQNQKLSRLLSVVNDAQAKVALTTTPILADIEKKWIQEAKLAPVKLVATDIAKTPEPEFVRQSVTPESLAFLQYTSGSTGTPKGVMVTHGNIIHNQQLIHQAFGHSQKTIFVGWLPLFHDMGLIGNVLQPLYLGIPSILMPPVAFLQQPVRWLSAISRYKATTSGGPNFAYDLCIKQVQPEQLTDIDLSSWDVAFNGAEPIRPEILEQFGKKFASCGFNYRAFYPCYGMAETTLFTTGGDKNKLPVIQGVKAEELKQNLVVENDISSPLSRVFVGVGRPYMDTTVMIVNPESLTPSKQSEVGEIWISGGSVAAGYWNRPQATQETFQSALKDGGEGCFLRTGDLGFLSNGELFVTGRLKDVIIISGRNHYPQDIELTVENSHPALRSNCSAAFAIEMQTGECLVIACEVERTHLRHLNTLEIVRAIQIAVSTEHELEVYGVVLLKTGSIPKTSSGKIQRQACKLGFLEKSLNVVGEWQKTLESHQKINNSNLQQNSLSQNDALQNSSKSVEEIQAWLAQKLAEILQLSPEQIDFKQPLAVYGLSSVKAASIAAELEKWLGMTVAPTIVYDYPTIQALSDYLAPTIAPIKSSLFVSHRQIATEAIAIIGLGCRFPKAKNSQAFWSLLRSGVDAITKVPGSRWESENTWGGFLEQVDQFDPQFFSISPREASSMDPQQRLLLEVSWEALENAGLAAAGLAGSRGGVFIGISSGDYARLNGNLVNTEAYYGTGNALSITANRLSYFLDWHGPSWAVDTACSSSLVAVHQACQSLLLGECHLALAGGVNLMLSPQLTLTFADAKMMAADGRCKTFDALADGYVRSEGCGVVVLKCLSDALADGDNIQAIIRGSALNQDGLTNGLTAPNGNSQQDVIHLALAKAGVKPNQISYVETHGTGTSLGDPIEVNSLKTVLMEDRELNQPCWIGSVKTNIGHLEAAAGIAGLIKVVLSLEHGEIPPHLHLQQLNPYIQLEQTTIKIPTKLQPWLSVGQSRLAGVSAFGFGGTNAHVILEEAPIPVSIENSLKTEQNSANLVNRPFHLLTLSAKTEQALADLVQSYQNYLEINPELAIADVCFSANTGRSHFKHRLAIIAADQQELTDKLAKIIAKSEVSGVFSANLASNSQSPKIAFLFTGQGSQYINMGRQLYQTQPVFRRTLEQCDGILQSYLGEKSLLEVIYPENPQELNNFFIDQTAYTQPALFAIEYALAQLWQSWGIKPDVVMGHSVGEYVAATVAGVFSLEDGLKLIAHRGRLMQKLPAHGEMVAVMASEEKVNQLISPHKEKVALAAINGPESVVMSGEAEAIKTIVNNLESQTIKSKRLQVSHAFHSPLMEPMLAEFDSVARTISYQTSRIPIVSNLTGKMAGDEIATPGYWVRHISQPVQFAASMQTLQQQGYGIFVEIGAKPILLAMGQQCISDGDQLWLASLRSHQQDWYQLLESLAQLYVREIQVDWAGFERDYPKRRVLLPTYPFQRQRYWIESLSSDQLWRSHNHKSPHPPFEQKLQIVGKDWHFETATIEQQLRSSWSELIAHIDLNRYHNLLLQLEQLSFEYVLQAFTQMGWSFSPGESFSTELIAQRLNILPQHRKLLRRLLQIIAGVNILQFNSDRDNWQVMLTLANANPRATAESVLANYPLAETELTLLSRCGSQLSNVLQGALDPVQLVFPAADLSMATRLYQDSPSAKVFNTLVKQAVSAAIFQFSQNRSVQLLEIGAGTGGTTSYILPHLLSNQVEYTFTDISTLFTTKGQERFSEYPFVRYQILDIELDPTAQGFEPQKYDIIIAANVLHATSSISQTLQHIRKLLVPGGLLVLVELTDPQRWLDLTFGLLKGWWRFRDLDLRPDYPLLPVEKWQQVLQENGFEQTISLPQQLQQVGLNQQTIIITRSAPQKPIEGIEYNHTTSNQKQNWQLQNQIKKHPFLGYRLKDLASVANTYSWETEIDEQYLLNFKDYQIWDCVVMPQMAYIEIALAATEEAFGVKCKQLTNLQVHQPLFLSTKEQQKIQFILTFDSQSKIHFNAYSCQKNKQLLSQKWTLYATAQIHI